MRRRGCARLLRTSSHTIVRATQFFELIGRIADSSTDGDTVLLSPALVRPEAADDVVSTMADVAVGAPLNDTIELGARRRSRSMFGT